MKLHLIWDMDGTLVNSAPEILSTIQKALAAVGVGVSEAVAPLRIGPPLRSVIRNAFTEKVLPETQLDEAVKAFRGIYDSSDYADTIPYEGIDDILHDARFVHHVITNKPDLATHRILAYKGWETSVAEVLTPDALLEDYGRQLTKVELFQHFRSVWPEVRVVAIGDMANDAACARSVGIQAIGVLWGTGSREELQEAGCADIVAHPDELINVLRKYE